MKSTICLIILIFSTGLYAQSAIETDELFLKYEKEYINFSERANDGMEYENATVSFYSNFNNDPKQLKDFENNKNKERWLQKNFSKTAFSSANEALDSFAKLNQAKQNLDLANNKLGDLHKELSEKYDVTLIWETLQSRLKK